MATRATPEDEWIGVAEVAAEMKLSERAAWELIRRLGVPMLEPDRQVMKMARFRRGDWEAARDGAVKAPTPRVKVVPATAPPAVTAKKKPATKSGLAKLRGA